MMMMLRLTVRDLDQHLQFLRCYLQHYYEHEIVIVIVPSTLQTGAATAVNMSFSKSWYKSFNRIFLVTIYVLLFQRTRMEHFLHFILCALYCCTIQSTFLLWHNCIFSQCPFLFLYVSFSTFILCDFGAEPDCLALETTAMSYQVNHHHHHHTHHHHNHHHHLYYKTVSKTSSLWLSTWYQSYHVNCTFASIDLYLIFIECKVIFI